MLRLTDMFDIECFVFAPNSTILKYNVQYNSLYCAKILKSTNATMKKRFRVLLYTIAANINKNANRIMTELVALHSIDRSFGYCMLTKQLP